MNFILYIKTNTVAMQVILFSLIQLIFKSIPNPFPLVGRQHFGFPYLYPVSDGLPNPSKATFMDPNLGKTATCFVSN